MQSANNLQSPTASLSRLLNTSSPTVACVFPPRRDKATSRQVTPSYLRYNSTALFQPSHRHGRPKDHSQNLPFPQSRKKTIRNKGSGCPWTTETYPNKEVWYTQPQGNAEMLGPPPLSFFQNNHILSLVSDAVPPSPPQPRSGRRLTIPPGPSTPSTPSTLAALTSHLGRADGQGFTS